MKKQSMLAGLLASTFIVGVFFGGVANASSKEFFAVTVGYESGGSYSIQNTQVPTNTAFGAYQIIFKNWRNMGYVTGTNWNNVQFTEKSRALGVNSVNELGKTDAGKAMQDMVADQLGRAMYSELSSTAKGFVGKEVNGVFISDAGMLGATWFLGSGDMNKWAANGLTVEGLRNHPNIATILKHNPTFTVESLAKHLYHRMETLSQVDISDITNGTNQLGDGSGYQTTSTTTTTEIICEEDVSAEMAAEKEEYIHSVVSAAQDQDLGYSQMEEPFGALSCLDGAFSGGLDILFQTPNLQDIGGMATKSYCSKVSGMVGQATAGLTGALGKLNFSGTGSGPFAGYGVTTNYNSNGSGINVGVDGANGATKTKSSTPAAYIKPTPGGLSALFSK
jgi:hypothetical protein